MALNVYLGIDVGSVTTKLALVDETGAKLYVNITFKALVLQAAEETLLAH